MKKVSVLTLILAFCVNTWALQLAFPGADGAAKYAVGGRGGQVIEVTNLNDSGSGSLRAAVATAGPRIVVFRVSGTIELNSPLLFQYPYITVAGQTAPGDGICLKGRHVHITGQETVIRYIRFRPGEESREDVDAMTLRVGGENVMIDHCSLSWSVDEILSPESPEENEYFPNFKSLTVQWSIVANALDKSVHPKGTHSKGTLAYGGYGSEWSFHHNIYAHNMARNPRVAGKYHYTVDPNGALFDFRNNVVYNWGGSYAGYSRGTEVVKQINFVGNYYKPGVNSSSTTLLAFDEAGIISKGHFADNYMVGIGYPADPWDLVRFVGFTPAQEAAYKEPNEIPMPSVATDDALTAYDRVLAGAGATLPRRDSVDRQLIYEISTGTGEKIDCTQAGDFYFPTGYYVRDNNSTSTTLNLTSDYPGFGKGQIGYDFEILSGTGAGQIRTISYFHDAENPPNDTTKWFIVSPAWTTIPDTTSEIAIIIDCTKNAGGWPTLDSATPPVDSDHDGMPDEWETARGLNPADSSDGDDVAASGYTNVEDYLNYLVLKKDNFPADFDNDGDVDPGDLDWLTDDWLDNDCNDLPWSNLDEDCDVDLEDFAIFGLDWLQIY